jgi:hypothetical protein
LVFPPDRSDLDHQVARTAEGQWQRRAPNRRVVFTVIGGTGNVKTRLQGAGDDTK